MSRLSDPFTAWRGHEQVVVGHDESSGLRAVVAIHSTALGPALGGTRFHSYVDRAAALADVLLLSRAMSYKNALAGLPHGGGKAVIIGDPRRDRSTAMLHAYGRLVAGLSGRYVTAADVGSTVSDMDVIAEVCPFTTGRSPEHGGAGDSGILTAYGVFEGMRACAERLWGEPTLAGRRVGIAGVGKVGRRLAQLLTDDAADVVVADPDADAVAMTRAEVPSVSAVDPDELAALELDVYSPCAMGHALTDTVVAGLRARLVCGGANNQLAHDGIADALAVKGVLYAPDFMVNCGGVIQVADELLGFDMDRARGKVAAVHATTHEVLDAAEATGVTPVRAAERVAEARMAAGASSPGATAFRSFRDAAPGRPLPLDAPAG